MGVVPEQIASRGVADPAILPYYPYRDDACGLYAAIERYVRSVVEGVYGDPDRLAGDCELQQWRRELTQPRDKGGVGLLGVPGDDAKGTEHSITEYGVFHLSQSHKHCYKSHGHDSMSHGQMTDKKHPEIHSWESYRQISFAYYLAKPYRIPLFDIYARQGTRKSSVRYRLQTSLCSWPSARRYPVDTL